MRVNLRGLQGLRGVRHIRQNSLVCARDDRPCLRLILRTARRESPYYFPR